MYTRPTTHNLLIARAAFLVLFATAPAITLTGCSSESSTEDQRPAGNRASAHNTSPATLEHLLRRVAYLESSTLDLDVLEKDPAAQTLIKTWFEVVLEAKQMRIALANVNANSSNHPELPNLQVQVKQLEKRTKAIRGDIATAIEPHVNASNARLKYSYDAVSDEEKKWAKILDQDIAPYIWLTRAAIKPPDERCVFDHFAAPTTRLGELISILAKCDIELAEVVEYCEAVLPDMTSQSSRSEFSSAPELQQNLFPILNQLLGSIFEIQTVEKQLAKNGQVARLVSRKTALLQQVQNLRDSLASQLRLSVTAYVGRQMGLKDASGGITLHQHLVPMQTLLQRIHIDFADEQQRESLWGILCNSTAVLGPCLTPNRGRTEDVTHPLRALKINYSTRDGYVVVLDRQTREELTRIDDIPVDERGDSVIASAVLTADHSQVLIIADEIYGDLFLYDAATGDKLPAPWADLKVTSVRFDENKSKMVTMSKDDTLTVWDTKTWKALATIKDDDGDSRIDSAFFHPSRPELFVILMEKYHEGRPDGFRRIVVLWDIVSGQRTAVLRNFGSIVEGSISCSLDGSLVVTGALGGEAKLWRIDTSVNEGKPGRNGAQVVLAVSHKHSVLDTRLSPDASRLLTRVGSASQSSDSNFYLWDATNGRQLVHTRGEMAFSPDGSTIMVHNSIPMADAKHERGYREAGFYIHDSVTGEEVVRIDVENGMRKNVSFSAFRPDGLTIALKSRSGTGFYSTSTGKRTFALQGTSKCGVICSESRVSIYAVTDDGCCVHSVDRRKSQSE